MKNEVGATRTNRLPEFAKNEDFILDWKDFMTNAWSDCGDRTEFRGGYRVCKAGKGEISGT